MAVIIVANKRW